MTFIFATFACIAISFAMAAGGLTASAAQFSHGTARFNFEVARPGVVDVLPGTAKVNRLLVVEGQKVLAGEVVAEIDTRELDLEMSALKDQVAATRRKLDAVRLEAQSFNILLEQGLVSRQRVADLEGRVAELEANAGGLISKLAITEARLANAEVRAPVAGVVGSVLLRAAGEPYAASDIMFRITTDPSSIVLESKLGAADVDKFAAAMVARVWLGEASFSSANILTARLTWREYSARPVGSGARVASDLASDVVSEMLSLRLEIIGGLKSLPIGTALVPGQRVTVFLPDPQRTLGQQFFDPIRRNLRLPMNSMNWRS